MHTHWSATSARVAAIRGARERLHTRSFCSLSNECARCMEIGPTSTRVSTLSTNIVLHGPRYSGKGELSLKPSSCRSPGGAPSGYGRTRQLTPPMPMPQVPPPAQMTRIPPPTRQTCAPACTARRSPIPYQDPSNPSRPLGQGQEQGTKGVARVKHQPSSLEAEGSSAPSSAKAGAPHLAPALKGKESARLQLRQRRRQRLRKDGYAPHWSRHACEVISGPQPRPACGHRPR